MSTATTIEISSAFVNVMDISVAFSERATNTILPNGNVYIPPSDTQTTIQYSSNLKSLSNLGTSGLVTRMPSGNFVTVALTEGLVVETSGGTSSLSVDPTIIAASQLIYNEMLAGIDGVTTVFYTAQTHVVGTVQLYYNGIRVPPTAFTSNGESITLVTFTPLAGDYLMVDYRWTT